MSKILGCLISVLILTFIVASSSFAARFEQNPDHVSSMGISVGLGREGGALDVKSMGTPASQDFTADVFEVLIDVRIPISESLTWFGGLSYFRSSSQFDKTMALNGTDANSDGVFGRIGVRAYFK